MSPSWNDAPSWAMFVARDEDGKWFWYEHKPAYNHMSGMWQVPVLGRFAWCDSMGPAEASLTCRQSNY